MLGGAAPSGLLVPGAAAQVARRPEDEHDSDEPLLLTPADDRLGGGYLAHRSHSSHRSHRSHSSHRSHYSSRNHSSGFVPYVPPPPPPKPATVSFLAYPGGRIYVNSKLMGTDSTGAMSL